MCGMQSRNDVEEIACRQQENILLVPTKPPVNQHNEGEEKEVDWGVEEHGLIAPQLSAEAGRAQNLSTDSNTEIS